MRKITFDIETSNFFHDTGSNDPASLSLACICIHDSATDAYTSYLEEDLGRLWPVLEKADLLIGYNSEHFDIPLLNKYYPGDLTIIKSIDLMKEIKKSLGRRIKLDVIAEATLGRKKIANGILATSWWRKGEKEKVVEYCLEDVRLTKEIYDYVRKHGHVKYRDGKMLRELALNTALWEAPTAAALTHTLPF